MTSLHDEQPNARLADVPLPPSCEDCLFWAGFAGKVTDFGWYAPCVREESPSFLKVTHCTHRCDRWQSPILSDDDRERLRAQGYRWLSRASLAWTEAVAAEAAARQSKDTPTAQPTGLERFVPNSLHHAMRGGRQDKPVHYVEDVRAPGVNAAHPRKRESGE